MVDEVVEDGAAAVVVRKGVGSFPIFDFYVHLSIGVTLHPIQSYSRGYHLNVLESV